MKVPFVDVAENYAIKKALAVCIFFFSLLFLILVTTPSWAKTDIWDGRHTVKELPMKINRSRIFLNSDTARGFAVLKNQSVTPFYVSAFLMETNDKGEPEDKSCRFFVTPASKVMRPKDSMMFHVIKRSKQTVDEDRETLLTLELKLIPQVEKKDIAINEMMTIYLKVFYRPKALDKSEIILESTKKITVTRTRINNTDGLILKNNSPYWLTVPVINDVRTDAGDKKRSAMLNPFGSYFFPSQHIYNEVVVQTIDENGFYTDPVKLSVQ